MRKINEIFYSLQGEGYFTGSPSIFVRFSGCNLKCPFCDTEHTHGQWMEDDEIFSAISPFPASHLVLTGGEPSLFIDEALIDRFHNAGYFVQIETNGTQLLPENIDWITCSPKSDAQLALTKADELKIVFTGQDISVYDTFEARYRFLQPCSNRNTDKVIDFLLKNPGWRLSLQTHKFIDIR